MGFDELSKMRIMLNSPITGFYKNGYNFCPTKQVYKNFKIFMRLPVQQYKIHNRNSKKRSACVNRFQIITLMIEIIQS